MTKALPLLSMGETFFSAFPSRLQASVWIAKGDTGPMHLFNCIINHVNEASVSEWNMPMATGNIKLCPSRALQAAN
jgi:hypothetical protein